MKLSDAQTTISIADKTFTLHEMKIGRAKEFGFKAIAIADAFVKEKDGKGKSKRKLEKLEIEAAFTLYGDMAFEKLTEILNWLFSYKNSDYTPVSQKWFEDNLSIREITLIGKEVARQNQLEWLTNFFQANFQQALKMVKG